MATVKTFFVAACCGLILLGAVSAHAGIYTNGLGVNGINLNGLRMNGLALNGVWLNGVNLNGLALNGLWVNGLPTNGSGINGLRNEGLIFKESKRHGGPTSEGQREGLPFNGLSQSGLGKMQP